MISGHLMPTMTPDSPFLITTAIPYANGAPHIGHAYERIATDVLARFARLDGRDVLFVTGMDEHGQKMQQTAARENLTPLELADRTALQFEAMGDLLACLEAGINVVSTAFYAYLNPACTPQEAMQPVNEACPSSPEPPH